MRKKKKIVSLLIVILTLTILVYIHRCPLSLAWDTTQNENILTFDEFGEIQGSYHLNDWTVQITGIPPFITVNSLTFLYTPGTITPILHTQNINIGSINLAVLPNNLSGSLPAPPGLSFPLVSLYNFDPAIFKDFMNLNPGISITPSPGTYSRTLMLKMRAFPASATIQFREQGAASWIDADNEKTLFIHKSKTLELRALRIIFPQTYYSDIITASYTINQDFRVDSDKDGLPDEWEIAKGLNPLHNDKYLDSDGDGITDVDEILRGSDPFSQGATTEDNDCDGWTDFDEQKHGTNPNNPLDTPSGDNIHSTPLDSDCDGWSDFDEGLRGTNPLDANSKPVARHLYEVEAIISGKFFLDINLGIPFAGPTTFCIKDLLGQELACGTVVADGSYGPLRIPVGEPGIISAWGDPQENFVLKRYLHNILSPSAADVPGNWIDASDWETKYKEFLSNTLLQNIPNYNINPLDMGPIALAERELEYLEDLPVGIFILLGKVGVSMHLIHLCF